MSLKIVAGWRGSRHASVVRVHDYPSCSSHVPTACTPRLAIDHIFENKNKSKIHGGRGSWIGRRTVCQSNTGARWGGTSGEREDALFDNVEVSDVERREMAERLRKRRLEKRRALGGGKKSASSRDDSVVVDEAAMRRAARTRGERKERSRGDVPSSDEGVSSSFYGWGEEGSTSAGVYERRGADAEEGDYGSWWDADDESIPLDDDLDDDDVVSDDSQNTRGYEEPPDIVILSPDELDRVLPVLPFAAQAEYFTGGAAQALQRWGASLALTILFSKAALLAATSLTWPLWWPWARAANKNIGIRSKMEYGGVWRTRLLEVENGSRPRPKFGDMEDVPRFMSMKSSRIVIGEELGAQTELVLPYDARFEVLQPGQPAEVLVLSNTTSFDEIKAIKDVYLPDSGLWLSEYPYIDRAEYLEISLDIEREVQQQQQYM